MAILRRFTPLVEPISIDEAFLDVTGSAGRLFGDGPTIARRIKDEVRAEVGLTASVGVAATKLVAKIASDLRKPDGLVVVAPGEEAAFLAPLAIGRLWGVGEKTAAALAEYGVRTIGDLAALPPDLLERRFGKHGASLVGVPAGSTRTRSTRATRPSRSGTSTPSTSTRATPRSSSGPSWDGRRRGRAAPLGRRPGRHRHGQDPRLDLPDDHPPADLAEPTDLTEPIFRAALELARPEVRGMRVRLLGVTASNLGEREQLALFEATRATRAAPCGREAADALRRRYGERAVTRARLLGTGLPAPFERDPRNPLDRRAARRRRAPTTGRPSPDGRRRDSRS